MKIKLDLDTSVKLVCTPFTDWEQQDSRQTDDTETIVGIPLFYEEDDDHKNVPIAILSCICVEMERVKAFEFTFGACGDPCWPVNTDIELCIFLEHLPDALRALKSSSDFEIYFYEQGVERRLQFEYILEDDTYKATCFGHIELKTDMTPELVDRMELYRMLFCIRVDFLAFLAEKAPEIASHPWLVEFFQTKDDGIPQN